MKTWTVVLLLSLRNFLMKLWEGEAGGEMVFWVLIVAFVGLLAFGVGWVFAGRGE